ncbi:MAG: TIM barrel protein [Clostridiales bacterium]|nr:TIM barrel protein [Clostridiales bacterium]
MRFGGGVRAFRSPEEWIANLREFGYGAAIFPVDASAPRGERMAYADAAQKSGMLIGEVGAWGNPLSRDAAQAAEALARCKAALAMADEVGARCCVNISGTASSKWDAYDPWNYTDEAYMRIVYSVRDIIDSVRPARAFYTLEPMPWMHPWGPDDYLQLLRDVDRPEFGAHMDCCNMINSMERYHSRSQFVSECFEKLGPHIKSVHIKDIRLDANALPLSIKEVQPGSGAMDFAHMLKCAAALGDVPVFTEHLGSAGEYLAASLYVRGTAKKAGITLAVPAGAMPLPSFRA